MLSTFFETYCAFLYESVGMLETCPPNPPTWTNATNRPGGGQPVHASSPTRPSVSGFNLSLILALIFGLLGIQKTLQLPGGPCLLQMVFWHASSWGCAKRRVAEGRERILVVQGDSFL